jgi:hypothetical protein
MEFIQQNRLGHDPDMRKPQQQMGQHQRRTVNIEGVMTIQADDVEPLVLCQKIEQVPGVRFRRAGS